MTPEGKIKIAVKRVLDRHKSRYEIWPVPYGYGASTLDCLVCLNGLFLAIEVKKPGGKPTDRQKMIMRKIAAAGGAVFLIDGVNGELEKLQEWLDEHDSK